MQYRKFGSKYIVRIDRGEEILASLKKLCGQEKIALAEVKALGAVDDFNVGLFDVAEKKYHTNHFTFLVQQRTTLCMLWRNQGYSIIGIVLHKLLSLPDRTAIELFCLMIGQEPSQTAFWHHRATDGQWLCFVVGHTETSHIVDIIGTKDADHFDLFSL